MHTIAYLSMIVAGGTHLWLVPHYWPVAPMQALVFASIGTLQVLWGVIFCWRPSEALYRWGIYMAGGSITLWLITRIAPVPFGPVPDLITGAEIIVKLAEVHALGAVVAWAFKEPMIPLKPVAHSLAAIGIGIGAYVLGVLLEGVL